MADKELKSEIVELKDEIDAVKGRQKVIGVLGSIAAVVAIVSGISGMVVSWLVREDSRSLRSVEIMAKLDQAWDTLGGAENTYTLPADLQPAPETFENVDRQLRYVFELDPGNPRARTIRGVTLRLRGEIESAKEEFKEAAEEARRRGQKKIAAKAVNDLGELVCMAGRPGRALELWLEAIDLDPEYGTPRVNSANEYRKMGRMKDAEKAYREAAARDARVSAAAYNNLGDMAEEDGDLERAIGDYRKATSTDARLGVAWANLAACINELHDCGLLSKSVKSTDCCIEATNALARAEELGFVWDWLGKSGKALFPTEG